MDCPKVKNPFKYFHTKSDTTHYRTRTYEKWKRTSLLMIVQLFNTIHETKERTFNI